MNCNDFCNNSCSNVPLIICKTDSISGMGIPGAVFELTSCDGSTCSGTTDSNGSLLFGVLPCNIYTLREVGVPSGYAPVAHVYSICVDSSGCIFIDSVLTSQLIINNTPISASFTAIKVNILNGMPLAGATYTLFLNSSAIASTVSTSLGQITFANLSPGTYEIVETTPPPGFQTNSESLTVVVAENGSVTIMDQPANGFILSDVPLGEFIFLKLDASTGSPLAGATFVLTQNGTEISTVTSDSDGLLNFGVLAAGMYQLNETIAPPGFPPNSTVYQVVIGTDGSITVNNIPLDDFTVEDTPIALSAPPTIYNIYEEEQIIAGTGVPGSLIVVTLPNDSTVNTTVGSNGTWLINVPAGVDLFAGDVVSAVQTEPGKLPSYEVHATVLALVDAFLDKSVDNLTSSGVVARPGDLLQYTIHIGNLGGLGSVWPNVVLEDVIDEDFTFVPDTVAIDGQLIPVGTGVGQYIYDSATRTLSIRVGDLASREIMTITFQVTVNLDASGEEIINSVTASSTFADGPVISAISPAFIVTW